MAGKLVMWLGKSLVGGGLGVLLMIGLGVIGQFTGIGGTLSFPDSPMAFSNHVVGILCGAFGAAILPRSTSTLQVK